MWSTIILLGAEYMSGPQFGVLDQRRLAILGLEVAALPFGAALVAMRPMLRSAFGILVCVPFVALSLSFSAFLALVMLNREFDRGPSIAHREVAIQYTWHAKGGSHTGFKIQSWVDPRDNVVVDSCEFHCPDLRDMVTVYARPGWLGFEWIARYSFDE